MPLPPALAARLAKRGLIQGGSSSGGNKNKENFSQPKFVEEVIAENYDDPVTPDNKVSSIPPPPQPVSLSSSSMVESSSNYHSSMKKSSSTSLTKFHRMGHYGCPNKSNIYHSCNQFCVTRWGRGKTQPSTEYNRRRLKMLKKYPLSSTWIEVYDPGAGRYYYWNTTTDDVCWLSPLHPKAKIGRSAPELREKQIEDDKAAAFMPPPSASSSYDKRLSRKDKRRMARETEELDPMDPASYSPDCPRGTWTSGLVQEETFAADTTASGPLFQQRPYPSPGEILRRNSGKK